MNPFGVFVAVVGLLVLIGAVFDLAFIMDSFQSRLLSNLITPTGARIFYFVLGLLATLLGLVIAVSPMAAAGGTP